MKNKILPVECLPKEFYEHLRRCRRCQETPFDMCLVSADYLNLAYKVAKEVDDAIDRARNFQDHR